jgi:chemotaxis protein methyltransferase CheR
VYSLSAVDDPPDPELVRIRDLIYQEAGIFHPDTKLRLLFDRCAQRMKELKASSLREYFEHLTLKPTRQAELIALLNEITIGETCFFRCQPQLDAVRQIILPKIVAAKAGLPVRRLRIWSAGCSTGEEPYTLSMIMQEESQQFHDWTIEIFATDLNERSLAHARNATYSADSTRRVTPLYQQKYFGPVGEELQVHPLARKCVTFTRLNLSDDAHMASVGTLGTCARSPRHSRAPPHKLCSGRACRIDRLSGAQRPATPHEWIESWLHRKTRGQPAQANRVCCALETSS